MSWIGPVSNFGIFLLEVNLARFSPLRFVISQTFSNALPAYACFDGLCMTGVIFHLTVMFGG